MGAPTKSFIASFNGKPFQTYYATGKVLDTNTRAETEVHGSGGGGGGFSYQGTGGSSAAPIRITSTTTRYTKIFLLERDGRERAIELVDFDVRCRAGNGLTMVWAIQSGKEEGPYIAAFNHSTRDMEFNMPLLAKLNTPMLISVLAGIGGGFVLGLLLHMGAAAIITALIGWGIGGAVAKSIGKRRAKAFVSGSQMSGLRAELEQVPASELAVLTPAA